MLSGTESYLFEFQVPFSVPHNFQISCRYYRLTVMLSSSFPFPVVNHPWVCSAGNDMILPRKSIIRVRLIIY
jgi:hypothetical protein